MSRNSVLFFIILQVFPVCVFSQQGASALRDYVGLINQSYHPGIVSYFEKAKAELAKQKETDAVRNIDIFLSGAFGSGFLYNDARGNLYVITNNHVVAQAHTLSITFEHADGTKRKIENLKIIAADAEADLAILSIPAEGNKPFVTQGLAFITRQIEEGADVFSAGFPGLGITPLWQFGRGMVSNSSAKFPKSIDDQTLLGPFIQHTAQVDAGNSGGPLLITVNNVPSGYAVAGINTLKAASRQAANFAIPAPAVQEFIYNALNPKPETFRDALDQKLEKFIGGIRGKTSVYQHIAEFLSASCMGENAEYASLLMFEKAPRSVLNTFFKKCEEGIIDAMGIAIGWTIEDSLRNRGPFSGSIKEVTGSGEEYTVIFIINNTETSSVWVREYGNWRIKTFGAAATGDTERLEQKRIKSNSSKLRMRSFFLVEAGYAALFEKEPDAFYTGLEFLNYGLKIYTAGNDFSAIGFYLNFSFPIPVGSSFGLIPFIRFGFDYQIDKEFEKIKKTPELPVSAMGMLGLRFTTSYAPGLFLGAGFQLNIFNFHSFDPFNFGDVYDNPMKTGLAVTAGYAF